MRGLTIMAALLLLGGSGSAFGAEASLSTAHAATAAASVVKPGALEIFNDWTIGCDNGLRCVAVSLQPENDPIDEGLAMLGFARDAGPSADVEAWVRFTGEGMDSYRGLINLMVDGRTVARGIVQNGAISIVGPQASALAIAVARGHVLEVKAGEKRVGKPSLKGASAALRNMDARQGRGGTVTALVATGGGVAGSVRAAPPLPVVRRRVPAANFKAVLLTAAERATADRISGCTRERSPVQPEQAEHHPLTATQTLVLVPCGAGAYNYLSVPVVATRVGTRRSLALARFDYAPGWGGEGGAPMLVNADWDAKAARLSSFAKGRGLGDCGNSEDYVWDGSMFRLVQASAMGECRGAWEWITVWRAKAVP